MGYLFFVYFLIYTSFVWRRLSVSEAWFFFIWWDPPCSLLCFLLLPSCSKQFMSSLSLQLLLDYYCLLEMFAQVQSCHRLFPAIWYLSVLNLLGYFSFVGCWYYVLTLCLQVILKWLVLTYTIVLLLISYIAVLPALFPLYGESTSKDGEWQLPYFF